MNDQPPRHSVSVSGIITDDHGHAQLIQRRDNRHWEPPGGVLELNETIQDGLRREVREETGLASDAYAVRLLDALRSDTAPVIRHHDGTNLL